MDVCTGLATARNPGIPLGSLGGYCTGEERGVAVCTCELTGVACFGVYRCCWRQGAWSVTVCTREFTGVTCELTHVACFGVCEYVEVTIVNTCSF